MHLSYMYANPASYLCVYSPPTCTRTHTHDVNSRNTHLTISLSSTLSSYCIVCTAVLAGPPYKLV